MRAVLHDIAAGRLSATAAIPAVTCYDAATAISVVEAADDLAAPVVLLVPPAMAASTEGPRTIRALRAIADSARQPVCVQLDHATDVQLVEAALDAGVDAVLADGSSRPMRDNAAFVRTVKALCGPGVTLEAELGSIVGNEDRAVDVDPLTAGMTKPDEVEEFVASSGCHLLAVAVGNVHGRYRGRPLLDRGRLDQISRLSPVPLVLHGASGLPRDDLALAGASGIAKVNINTELRGVVLDVLEAGLLPARSSGDDVWTLTNARATATREFTASFIHLLSGTVDRVPTALSS